MSGAVNLNDLIAYSKDRSDMVNSKFIDDATWTRYINQAAKEFYDLIVDKGLDYFTISAPLVLDGANDTFSLPADFYKLIGIDYDLSGVTRNMYPMNFEDRNRDIVGTGQTTRYRLFGNGKIMFRPKPAGQTITIWYVPIFEELSNGTDTLTGFNGWEEYVVVRAARYALVKEESDTSNLDAELKLLRDRIDSMANNRDQGGAARVTDLRRSTFTIHDLLL